MIKQRDYKFIDDLAKIAADVTPIRSARIAASIVISNNIISVGVNSTKTHSFQKRFSKNPDWCYWHAETNAIYNALKRIHITDLMNSTLYISRVKFDGPLHEGGKFVYGIAKPCGGCQRCINWSNIGRVVFTTDEQTLEEL